MTCARRVAGTSPRPNSATNRSPARVASSTLERRKSPSVRRNERRPRARLGAPRRGTRRSSGPPLRSQALSCRTSTPDCRHEKRPSPTSRKGSVKYSNGAPSLSTASTSSSAVTLLEPVSMADTVRRSLNPNISARRSCESLRSSRSALIRRPIRRVVIGTSRDFEATSVHDGYRAPGAGASCRRSAGPSVQARLLGTHLAAEHIRCAAEAHHVSARLLLHAHRIERLTCQTLRHRPHVVAATLYVLISNHLGLILT